MLSIAIPVYNHDISQLLEHLERELSEGDIISEIIIMDDSSTDISLKSNNKNRAKQYLYLENTTNLGRVATRLALAKEAHYDWILFMDADVIPLKSDFISSILKEIDQEQDLIFGGITYTEELNHPEHSLRWLYGKKSESKSCIERKNLPYASVVSQHFCIRKSVAVSIFSEMKIKAYGMDILFTYLLEKHQVNVVHINNPTVHLGLEKNEEYIEKTMKGLETTYHLERQGLIPINYRPVQQKSVTLSKLYVTSLFLAVFSVFIKSIESNLKSAKPNLILFRLYKLYHFIKIKRAKYS